MADEPKFKPGDVVMLKSGGAPMTVVRPRDDAGLVYVAWHNHGGFSARDQLPEYVLLKMKDPPPAPEDDDYVFTGEPEEPEE